MNNVNIADRIVTATELRRNFGEVTSELVNVESLIITKGGEPFAILKAAPAKKRKVLMETAGEWKGTKFDDDKFWKTVLEKKSREDAVDL